MLLSPNNHEQFRSHYYETTSTSHYSFLFFCVRRGTFIFRDIEHELRVSTTSKKKTRSEESPTLTSEEERVRHPRCPRNFSCETHGSMICYRDGALIAIDCAPQCEGDNPSDRSCRSDRDVNVRAGEYCASPRETGECSPAAVG